MKPYIWRLSSMAVLMGGLAAVITIGSIKASPAKFLTAEGVYVITQIIDNGETTCPGGPCDLKSPVHIRGQVFEMTGSSQGDASSLFGPSAVIKMNCNLDSLLTGPCWGTFEWNLPGEGKWTGVWQGKFDLQNYTGSYHSIGHGEGGCLKGLKFKREISFSSGRTSHPPTWNASEPASLPSLALCIE